jgi:hypothetical protein
MIPTPAQAASDCFVPLVAGRGRPLAPVLGTLNLKAPAQPPLNTAFQPLSAIAAQGSSSADTCSEPKVSLQRNGDVVSAIHIHCGCGRAIELTCVY